ncbi:MAG: hypothetical protein ACQESG_04020 [Nanobdellota archaeon]
MADRALEILRQIHANPRAWNWKENQEYLFRCVRGRVDPALVEMLQAMDVPDERFQILKQKAIIKSSLENGQEHAGARSGAGISRRTFLQGALFGGLTAAFNPKKALHAAESLSHTSLIKSVLNDTEYTLFTRIERLWGFAYGSSSDEPFIRGMLKQTMERIAQHESKLDLLGDVKLKKKPYLVELQVLADLLASDRLGQVSGTFDSIDSLKTAVWFAEGLSMKHYDVICRELGVRHDVSRRYSYAFLDTVYKTYTGQITDKPLAVFIFNRYDPMQTGGFAFGLEKPNLDSFIPGYRILLFEIDRQDELLQVIRRLKPFGQATVVNLAAHGHKLALMFGPPKNNLIDERSVLDIFDHRMLMDFRNMFAPGSTLILNSCSTGNGELNIARLFFEILNPTQVQTRVIAPREDANPPAFMDFREGRLTDVRFLSVGKNEDITVTYDTLPEVRIIDFVEGLVRSINEESLEERHVKALQHFGLGITPRELQLLVRFYHQTQKGWIKWRLLDRISKEFQIEFS